MAATRYSAARIPRYTWNYVEQLKTDYCAVAGQEEAVLAICQRSTNLLTWGDLFTLESAILRVNPPNNLRRVVWRWRSRFRSIAGESSFQIYQDSKPPDASTGDVEDIRADLASLAAELHYLYILSPARESARDRFSLWSFAGVVFALSVIGYLIAYHPTEHFPALAVILASGWAGGLISVQERLHNLPDGDPLFRHMQLASTKWSILFSPLTGSFFAIILYLAFAAGLIDGTLFPKIATIGVADPNGMPFEKFTKFTGPFTGTDWAKLIVWCFVAGFAERLVPDMLNRFAINATASQDRRQI